MSSASKKMQKHNQNQRATSSITDKSSFQQNQPKTISKRNNNKSDESDDNNTPTTSSLKNHESDDNNTSATSSLKNNENEFVTDDVWKLLLQLYLRVTDQTKLKKGSSIFTKLGVFVHKTIKAVLIAQDN
ncbi:19110_t:CDS:2, partial [Racocetra fulgida]